MVVIVEVDVEWVVLDFGVVVVVGYVVFYNCFDVIFKLVVFL